jgi:Cu+-exporting ATPase
MMDSELPKDVVCGMDIDPDEAVKTEIGDQTFYFCCARCKAEFEKEPLRYIKKEESLTKSSREKK